MFTNLAIPNWGTTLYNHQPTRALNTANIIIMIHSTPPSRTILGPHQVCQAAQDRSSTSMWLNSPAKRGQTWWVYQSKMVTIVILRGKMVILAKIMNLGKFILIVIRNAYDSSIRKNPWDFNNFDPETWWFKTNSQSNMTWWCKPCGIMWKNSHQELE